MIVEVAFGASLHGTVYDVDLNTVNNAIVEIDSVPMQRTLSKDGQYSFELGPGKYALNAVIKDGEYIIASTKENLTIGSEGSYVFDLFLYPELNQDLIDETDNINVEDVSITDSIYNNPIVWVMIATLLIIAGVLYYFMYFKKRKHHKEEKKEEHNHTISDNSLDKIVEIIKKEGGRATQKDIRKEIPYSEAKISLMISELEHKGVVERIKKGRGNIIVLKK